MIINQSSSHYSSLFILQFSLLDSTLYLRLLVSSPYPPPKGVTRLSVDLKAKSTHFDMTILRSLEMTFDC